MATAVSAKVRMYRLNELGDCFLVTFTTDKDKSHLLVDCGSFRNSGPSVQRLQAVTAKIGEVLDGRPIDVVVGTHQHNDHLSGFVHCEKEFRDMGVGQVWLSWLDHPTDKQAQEIGKAHHNIKVKLARARDELHAALAASGPLRATAVHSLGVLDGMLGFHGAAAAGTPPELPAKGIEILKSLGKAEPQYLEPGQTLDMPGLPAETVRVHVLGPPRADDLLNRKDPRKGESYDHALAAAGLQAVKLLDATLCRRGEIEVEEEHYPFTDVLKRQEVGKPSPALAAVVQRYRQPNGWWTIDDAWTETAGALALFLDKFTNNSSLVLAIELVKSGKVLLFAADAQTGNWLSWKDVKWERDDVSTDDLLARTVFYKVGHHASHNATLPDAFERMTHADLVALIPVHKKDPNIAKDSGWKMPATNLLRRLRKSTQDRVLQMDDVNPPACDPTKDPAKAAWKRAGIEPRISDDSIELDIKG
ncbi:MAG TPA: MBL fold metallo-hydrolase [Thermoanaerobaculia bacterium]|nr:MBL fold metallo-hydrolase [Thermoanaerobaculia bacterium]